MAFHEHRFPEHISYGARGGPKFKTSVLVLSSGREKRNVDWELARAEYDVAHGLKTQADLDQLLAFFYTAQGMAHGFRFKDWADFELDQQVIGVTDTTTSEFQIYKRYSFGAVNFDRNLTKIVASSYTVWVNSVQLTEGVGAGQFQIDITTGVITLGATHVATTGQDVEVECEFDVPVRFNTDRMETTIEYFERFNWTGIMLVEERI